MGARTSRVLHRSLRETPPKAIGGEGVYLFAEDGRRVIDASGGAAVSCLGHQHPRVIAAMAKQASTLAYAHTAFFSSEPAEELAETLVGHEPGGLAYAYFVSGGSEAIEASIKLARQYFIERGEPQRQHFIARRQSYHGNTLGRARRRRQCLAPRALCAAAVAAPSAMSRRPLPITRSTTANPMRSSWRGWRPSSKPNSSGLAPTPLPPSSPSRSSAPPPAA